MIQRFIELGEGYSDLYELLEITNNNSHRLVHMMAFHTTKNNKNVTSLVVVLKPTNQGDFQPLYICREGIPNPNYKQNGRYKLFEEIAKNLNKTIIELSVKPSDVFAEKELFFQYLIGILRMNRYIPSLK